MASTKSIQIPLSSRGYELSATLDIKQNESSNIMIVCHGLLSGKSRGVSAILSDSIDYNMCRFDFAGNGESGGDWTYSGYDREVEDLREVIQYLRRENWIVSAIFGHSKGATAVLQYAAKFHDVPNVISLAGRYDTSKMRKSRFTEDQWRDLDETGSMQWIVEGKSYTILHSDFINRASLNMEATCTSIQGSKVHIIHGDADSTIPVNDAYEFHRRIPHSTLTIVKGGSHSFRTIETGRAEMIEIVRNLLVNTSNFSHIEQYDS